ncbi:MAG TPA: rhomboid family intramembrane serine protease [Polyangia bacterium]
MNESDVPEGSARLADRLVAAVLAVADRRELLAYVPMHEAQLSVIALPQLGVGVAVVERGDQPSDLLRERLQKLLAAHDRNILHLVLAGGSEADIADLRAADRAAPDPNRLGVHLLDREGRIRRIAGRRLPLLRTAAAQIPNLPALAPDALIAHIEASNERMEKRRQEAAGFASALGERSQKATRLLGVVNIALFALAMHWGARNFDRALMGMGANRLFLVEDGEVYRLLSHAFLHANAGHLLVNLIGLFSFGGFLEGLLGWRRIVLLYGLCALAGGIASAFIGKTTASVGASGAIWGFMAAGLAIVLGKRALLPPLYAARMRSSLLWVFVLNLALSIAPIFLASFPRIDLWAHLGGGVMGFSLAAAPPFMSGLAKGQDPAELSANPAWLRASALIVLGLMVVSVALALATGKPWDLPTLPAADEMA